MNYDRDIVNEYRERAITRIDQLVIGNTYFGENGKPFKLLKLLTNGKHYHDEGLVWKDVTTLDNIGWMRVEDNRGQYVDSLHDKGIAVAGSYNPWLIFADLVTSVEYYDKINPTINFDDAPDWDDFDAIMGMYNDLS